MARTLLTVHYKVRLFRDPLGVNSIQSRCTSKVALTLHPCKSEPTAHQIRRSGLSHMTPFLPELSLDGLVLWRLRRESHQQLWCSVSDFAGEFALTVNNLGTGQVLVAEAHPEISPLMNRVVGLRDQFVSAGWHEVDVDFDEPD